MLSGVATVNNGNTTIGDGSTVNLTGTLSTLTTTPWDPNAPPTTGLTYIAGGSTVSLSGRTASLKSGYDTWIGMDGTNGTLNVGLSSADSATVTLNSGLWVGGGTAGSANVGTINVRGNSTLSTTAGWNKIEIGDWGSATGVLNIYDSGTVSTGDLRVGHNDSSVGTVNVYNSGHLNSGEFRIGDNTDPSVAGSGGTVNLNNQSQMNATNTAGTTGNVYVGADGNGTLNVKDDSTVTVAGALVTSAWGYWTQITPGTWGVTGMNTGIVNIGGNNRVALQAGSISMEGVWLYSGTGHCTGTITVTDSAQIKTIGDVSVGRWNNTVATINLNSSAKADIGGQLIIGQADAAEGYVNVSGSTS